MDPKNDPEARETIGITLPRYQKKWVEKQAWLNLSGFVRMKLDEEIEAREKRPLKEVIESLSK
ncbi:MAG: hypothetical protein QXU98_05980, partial [Candidatus Parvarchaeota archaeon]